MVDDKIMPNCENCIHKIVCKRYINDGISQELRKKMIETGCENYIPYDVDKQNVTELILKCQKLEQENNSLNKDGEYVKDTISDVRKPDTKLCDFCSYCRQKLNDRKE